MNMKTRLFISKRLNATLATFAIAILATASTNAADDEFSRARRTDIYSPAIYLTGHRFEGYGAGLGVSYDFNDHFALNTEATAGALDVGRFGGAFYSGLVNVEYNLFKRRFTPFVTVGGGVLGFDVATGSGIGFISETKSSVHGVFGGGVGLRWDVTDHFFLKAAYRANEVTNGKYQGPAHIITIGLGGSF
jgi:OOP family OmpA-OmpF porin